MGDYTGFTYNDIHSSDLGLIRTSNGSRFSMDLLPQAQDKTVQVPGRDGAYYFGSTYTARELTVEFAFDGITEAQIREIRRVFGDKKIHYLVFDELPYKAYQAKVKNNMVITYIPFAEGQTNRLYKGEGSVTFMCYEPYAITINKSLSNYNQEHAIEWNDGANLRNLSEEGFDSIITDSVNNRLYIRTYNPGDKESDFSIRFIAKEDATFNGFTLSNTEGKSLTFNSFVSKKSIQQGVEVYDLLIAINTNNHLIEGYRAIYQNGQIIDIEKSGNLYNEYITEGDFFDIPLFESELSIIPKNLTLEEGRELFDNIDYNYYYY